MVFVNYKGDLINLQTPELRLPWDVNADYAEDANGKYNFTVSLDGYDSVIRTLRNFMIKLAGNG